MFTESMRKRKHPRHEHRTAVTVGSSGALHQYLGSTVDLSTGGCHIQFDQGINFSVGAGVEVWLRAASGMFLMTGSVRRVEEGGLAIGVEFTPGCDRSRREIEKLITSCILLSQEPSDPLTV
jgi:hypothetical protein